jgi:hypothetical protein
MTFRRTQIFALLLLTASAPALASVNANTSTTAGMRPSGSSSSGNFGLGLMFGEPTGLTAKYWLNQRNALSMSAAFSPGDYFEALVDYTWNFAGAFGTGTGAQFVPYIGLGAAFFSDTSAYPWHTSDVRFWNYNGTNYSSVSFGARVPMGVEFLPRTAPLGVFAEFTPGIGMYPALYGFFQGDLGMRFYF